MPKPKAKIQKEPTGSNTQATDPVDVITFPPEDEYKRMPRGWKRICTTDFFTMCGYEINPVGTLVRTSSENSEALVFLPGVFIDDIAENGISSPDARKLKKR